MAVSPTMRETEQQSSKEPEQPEVGEEEGETKDERLDTEFFDKMGDGEDDSQEESMEIDKGDVEGMRPRPQPRMPTKAEIERHNIDHYPYASWCPACVDGAGRADKHVRGGEEQNEKPVIACDYGSFGDNEESPPTAGGEEVSGETATPFLETR